MSVVFRNLRSARAAAFRAFQIQDKSVTNRHESKYAHFGEGGKRLP